MYLMEIRWLTLLKRFLQILFPFASGISGSMKQMKRRILNIASYQRPTLQKKAKKYHCLPVDIVLLLGLAPFVSTYAADEKSLSVELFLKKLFQNRPYQLFWRLWGSFVLYDLKKRYLEKYMIWNMPPYVFHQTLPIRYITPYLD